MNVMGAELSLLDCRMIEEGIKDRRWTEAFASTWVSLKVATFVLLFVGLW
jgi:hypothetical protein